MVTFGGGYSQACLAGVVSNCPVASGLLYISAAFVPLITVADPISLSPSGSSVISSLCIYLEFDPAGLNFTSEANQSPSNSTIAPICPVSRGATCTMDMTVPVSSYDPTQGTACLRLSAGRWVTDNLTTFKSFNSSNSAVTCTTSATGGYYVVIQFPIPSPPPPKPPPSPKPPHERALTHP